MGIPKTRYLLSSLLQAVLGVFLFAFAYRTFILPFHLYSGGFTGIAQILQDLFTRLFHISLPADLTGVFLWILNIPLFFLIYRLISRAFFIKTLITMSLQSLFMLLIPAPDMPVIQDCLTSCLVGGAISGFGAGLTLKAGSSGGGSDIVGLYCAKKFPRFSVGKFNLLLNCCIYGFSAWRYDFSTAVYSLLFSATASLLMDKVHLQNIQTQALIISSRRDMGNLILHQLSRGCTCWQGVGSYTQDPMAIYLTVISKYEAPLLKKLIHDADPRAFIIFTEQTQVSGNFQKRFDS